MMISYLCDCAVSLVMKMNAPLGKHFTCCGSVFFSFCRIFQGCSLSPLSSTEVIRPSTFGIGMDFTESVPLMPAIYQVLPFLRAMTTYSPGDPEKSFVSSHAVGSVPRKSWTACGWA